jgi:hypothetical protein
LVAVVEEGEIMGAQPVVTEDEVRVAVHVELHEGRLLAEAAQDQAGRHRAACGPGRTIGLPDRRIQS